MAQELLLHLLFLGIENDDLWHALRRRPPDVLIGFGFCLAARVLGCAGMGVWVFAQASPSYVPVGSKLGHKAKFRSPHLGQRTPENSNSKALKAESPSSPETRLRIHAARHNSLGIGAVDVDACDPRPEGIQV